MVTHEAGQGAKAGAAEARAREYQAAYALARRDQARVNLALLLALVSGVGGTLIVLRLVHAALGLAV